MIMPNERVVFSNCQQKKKKETVDKYVSKYVHTII